MENSFGSYSKDDVVFLLKDISSLIKEQGNLEREKAIQSGKHYSEMLPVEYQVSDEYIELYKSQLEKNKSKLAISVGVMCEKIIKKKGNNIVLVSLARAGTPIGVLAKRYIKYKYNIDLPHYSISIIRDKGIDENAIKYILNNHKDMKIQFIDGWIGKGTITNVLKKACKDFNDKYNVKIDDSLAVLTDPAGFASFCGLREDYLIPSACLNSTVSGLVSRTVLREDLIGKDDFHGAKYYKELEQYDLSNEYVDIISSQYKYIVKEVEDIMNDWQDDIVNNIGLKDVQAIKEDYNIDDINFIKPGIGETTRVLLRRVPYKILVNSINDKDLEHILILAREKEVIVEEYPLKSYKCCGIIKNMRDV